MTRLCFLHQRVGVSMMEHLCIQQATGCLWCCRGMVIAFTSHDVCLFPAVGGGFH